MEHWNRRQQLEEVHKAGGCVIQAHPFRMRNYMDRIRLGLHFCDGIEVANAGNDQMDDARAWLYGKENHLVMTAGSDNHCGANWPLYGVAFEKRLTSIEEYVTIIMNKYPVQLHIPEGRLTFAEPPVIDERHRALMLDESEREHPAEKEWID